MVCPCFSPLQVLGKTEISGNNRFHWFYKVVWQKWMQPYWMLLLGAYLQYLIPDTLLPNVKKYAEAESFQYLLINLSFL